MAKVQKGISNRFDQYEICFTFTQSTQEFIQKQKSNQPVHSKFILKCILGTLLAVNAYMSHWGPWKWPSNYYIILFSVIFYYTASTIYGKLSPVDNSQGNLVQFLFTIHFQIGQYTFRGSNKIFVMHISDSKMDYILQVIDSQSKQSLGKKTFIYYEYFTERGLFLEELYHKHLAGFLGTLKK